MNGRESILKPAYIYPSFNHFQVVITQVQQLADTKPVAEGKQDQATVPYPGLFIPGSTHQVVNFGESEKFTLCHKNSYCNYAGYYSLKN
ncbi:hypothetical protein D3C80_1953900 [compost metagenome]